MLIGSDAGQYDEILFPALKGIDTADFHTLVQAGLEGTLALHHGYNMCSLPLIRRDDPNLARFNSRLQQVGHHLFSICSLCTHLNLNVLFNLLQSILEEKSMVHGAA